MVVNSHAVEFMDTAGEFEVKPEGEEGEEGYDPDALIKHIEEKMTRKRREHFKNAMRKTTVKVSLIPKLARLIKGRLG